MLRTPHKARRLSTRVSNLPPKREGAPTKREISPCGSHTRRRGRGTEPDERRGRHSGLGASLAPLPESNRPSS